MSNNNPRVFSGKVLDERNDLTGPDDGNKTDHPKPPKHVAIPQKKR
jgi:hypothetical protein